MRRTAARRLAFDVAAFTGAASVGVRLWQSLRSRSAPACETTVVDDFGPWTDELWERVHREYLMLARRDTATLRARYPRTDRRFIRVQIGSNGRVIGHAVLLDTQMSGNKHFGNLRVGTLVDCFGSPADADCIVTAAAAVLARRGVDVIIANQCHTAWCDAFRRAGFLKGPSNRIFAASPQLAARLLQPFEAAVGRMHLTRGDAAGPIHL
jgi:hypothetical protein